MKPFILFVSITFCLVSFGQKTEVSKEVLQSIKTDVWIPFMEAYDELDSDKLKSIHSKDIVRVLINQNEVKTGEKYLNDFGGFLIKMKENGGKLGIAFAILSTAINETGDMAYQTGYYRLSSMNKGDEALIHRGYGHFNVALKQENGIWKLWLDSDKRVDITASEFLSQEIIYSLKS